MMYLAAGKAADETHENSNDAVGDDLDHGDDAIDNSHLDSSGQYRFFIGSTPDRKRTKQLVMALTSVLKQDATAPILTDLLE